MGKPREAVTIMTDDEARLAAVNTNDVNANDVDASAGTSDDTTSQPTPQPAATPDNPAPAAIHTPEPVPTPTPTPTPTLRRAGVSPTGKEPAPPSNQPDYSIPSPYYISNEPHAELGKPFANPQRQLKENMHVHNLHPENTVPAPQDVDARYATLGITRDNPQHPLYGAPVNTCEDTPDDDEDEDSVTKAKKAKK